MKLSLIVLTAVGIVASAQELPVQKIPNIGASAEFYFGPDSQTIIGNAKREGDDGYRVYTAKIDAPKSIGLTTEARTPAHSFSPTANV